jgi:hypothetical protein
MPLRVTPRILFRKLTPLWLRTAPHRLYDNKPSIGCPQPAELGCRYVCLWSGGKERFWWPDVSLATEHPGLPGDVGRDTVGPGPFSRLVTEQTGLRPRGVSGLSPAAAERRARDA